MAIIAGLKHKNITPYERYFFTKIENTTYIAVIRPYFKTKVSDIAVFTKFNASDGEICLKMIEALSHIHERYSMMFTLKASNCFIDSNGDLQITDIGAPSLVEYELESKAESLKIAMYTPPEIDCELTGGNFKFDIWCLGILFYELYMKCHPFDASTPNEALKLVNKEFVGVELNEGIIDDIIRGCLKQNPSERLSMGKINKHLKELITQENIVLEESRLRKVSPRLVSRSQDIRAQHDENYIERLDDPSEEEKLVSPIPCINNFFKVINKTGFSERTSQDILYNQKMQSDGTDRKEKLRCVNIAHDCHRGPINGIGVLDTGILVTSGENKAICFWNPMDNDLIAIINESGKVGKILTIPKTKGFYYVLGNEIKFFDPTIGAAEVIYQAESNITCLEVFQDQKYDIFIVGLKDGTIELVSRTTRTVSLSKSFHSGYPVVGVSGQGDYLLTTGRDDVVNIYNMRTNLLERELDLKNAYLDGVSGVLKMHQDIKEMIITDGLFGISLFSFDINNPYKEHPDINYRPVAQLFRNVSPNSDLFGATSGKGVVKIYHSQQNEDGSQSSSIREIRRFKGHKSKVTGIAYFQDGSYATCSLDGTYRIWSSRKDVKLIGKAPGYNGCCSSEKCVIQ
ncbi:unnamed protein product [Moneuplotes crassus]|uniref:Protein kinase domain-containing protein n=1 Tax=Euplotes crassus TaxID=5936 RepID=A0AAD1U0A4_EUPCR|nr:unnamed protein product [Moneuplotes crassus]